MFRFVTWSVRNLNWGPTGLGSFSAQILHHADGNADPLDHIDDATAQYLIAIHVRWRNEEISVTPISRPLETEIGLILE